MYIKSAEKIWVSVFFAGALIAVVSCSSGDQKKESTAAPATVPPTNVLSFDTNRYQLGVQQYAQYCQSCHLPLASSKKLGRTATQIYYASLNQPEMNTLKSLPSDTYSNISTALLYRNDGTILSTSGNQTTIYNGTTGTSALTEGTNLYAANCQSCHQPITTSVKRGRSAIQIRDAINQNQQMSNLQNLRNLTDSQLQNIATALAN